LGTGDFAKQLTICAWFVIREFHLLARCIQLMSGTAPGKQRDS
jgi:hypothetical protein